MWTVNSTDGLSYDIPIQDEYRPMFRPAVAGFAKLCSWYEEEYVEIPEDCPNISVGGYGMINIEYYGL